MIECKKEFIIVRTRLKARAHQKLETVNPGTKASTIRTATAFITRRKSPKVTKVIGNVRKIRTGLTKALITPSTTATMTAVRKSFSLTPGSKYPVIKTAIAFIRS